MAIERINYGAAPDDGTGDPLRTAFRKTDSNFSDLELRKAEEQDVADALARKQDAQPGMGLSQESYTTVEKNKLAGVVDNATRNRPDSETPAEAPLDGRQYARKDAGWSEVVLPAVVGTNLAIGERDSDTIAVTSSTGTGVTIPSATSDLAGLATAQQISQLLVADAMAKTFPSVPSTFQAFEILVTLPHLRKMVWDGAKYVRAPWHQPCQLFFSYDNPVTIPWALPVRADAVWQQADFPDVVARLGLSGTGTFSLVEARGEFLRVLDNGRGVDAERVLRSAQGDAGRNLTGRISTVDAESSIAALSGSGSAVVAGPGDLRQIAASAVTDDGWPYGRSTYVEIDASRQWPTANEFRMRNLAFPLWMTF